MKHTIQRLTLGLGALLLVTAPLTSVAAPPRTGIQGQAFLYISYGTPIEIEPGIWIGIPSVQLPVATTFTVLSAHKSREVARITTDANGGFALSLHPGKYVLVPDTLTMSFGCSVSTEPIPVTVRPKRFTTVNVFYFQEGPCSIVGTVP